MTETASPSPDQSNLETAPPQLVPPDEQFWKRYSPHAEFSLSSAGSLAIHILLFGLLGLMAWLGAILFNHSTRSLPVEAVRLAGGGGNPQGQGDGPNNGAVPVEASAQTQEAPAEAPPTEDKAIPKDIKAPTAPKLAPKFDDPSRVLQQSDSETAKSFQRLKSANSKIRFTDVKPSGLGQGGPGSGGGKGGGQGSSVGNGSGESRGNLTERERRLARWTMLMVKANQDYLNQIRDLGGILAVPIQEHAKPDEYTPKDYRLIRDLSARPPKLLEGDITQFNTKYIWIDEDPRSVALMMGFLGLSLKPSHFVVLFPAELEQKLFKLEGAYLEKRYPGRNEDDIEETVFELGTRGGKYAPRVKELKLRR